MSLCDRNHSIYEDGIRSFSEGDSDSELEPSGYGTDNDQDSPVEKKQVTSPSSGRARESTSQDTTAQTLCEITSALNKVVKRLDKTEEKLTTMQELLTSPPTKKPRKEHKVPPEVRSETRKMYRTLLDEDSENFPGFKTDPAFSFKHADNQSVVARVIREVQRENHTFIAADIRSAIYTYYKTICQEESLKKKGKLDDRKKQRRRRERLTRKLQDRKAAFQKKRYNSKDAEKWEKMLTVDFMSSEESDEEDDSIIVYPLPWRSDRIKRWFNSLDDKSFQDKSPQAKRQTKNRKEATTRSLRPTPTAKYPSWAVVQTE